MTGPILNRQASSASRDREIRAGRQLAGRKGKCSRIDQRLRVRPGHRGACRSEPRLRGGRIGKCTDAMRIGIVGAAKGGLGRGLQRDSSIVLLKPGIDLVS